MRVLLAGLFMWVGSGAVAWLLFRLGLPERFVVPATFLFLPLVLVLAFVLFHPGSNVPRLHRMRIVRVPSFIDPVLGPLRIDEHDDELWSSEVEVGDGLVKICIGGGEVPDAASLAWARALVARFEAFAAEVEAFLEREAADLPPDLADEARALSIEEIQLCWPDRPTHARIWFYAGEDCNVFWRCDYVGGKIQDFGFDD